MSRGFMHNGTSTERTSLIEMGGLTSAFLESRLLRPSAKRTGVQEDCPASHLHSLPGHLRPMDLAASASCLSFQRIASQGCVGSFVRFPLKADQCCSAEGNDQSPSMSLSLGSRLAVKVERYIRAMAAQGAASLYIRFIDRGPM